MWALCVVCEKERLKEVGEEEGFIRDLESEVRNGEKNMYFVCDFNGRWLKDLSFLCCFVIILNVGGRVGYVM
jgi:hypothetical protein